MKNPDFFRPTDEFIDKLIEVIGNRFVIEIGCGNGLILQELMKRNLKCIGFDPYVCRDEMSHEMSLKILPFETDEAVKMINEMANNMSVVLLVARPCHSKFPQEYLSYVHRGTEMIYIGYAKNLEIDFERELSLVRFVEFPEHPDCDCVAILEKGNYNQQAKKELDWANVDRKVQKLKGEISEEIKEWFKDTLIKSKKYSRIDLEEKALIEKAFPGIPFGNNSRFGGEWKEWENYKLLSRDVTKRRKVKLNITSYMVGGGHFYCVVEVDTESFVGLDDEGKIMTGRPWDREEGRPEWANHRNLTWYGVRENKRIANLESGLAWIKSTFEELSKTYLNELGIQLIPYIDSGLDSELFQIFKANDRKENKVTTCTKCCKQITQAEADEYDGECEQCYFNE